MARSAPKITALIVAAGTGSRAAGGGGPPKQFASIHGRPILARTIDAFLGHPGITGVRVVIHPDYLAEYREATAEFFGLDAPVTGGATRQESVRLGLESLVDAAPAAVLIHDAARPFVSPAVIDRAIAALATDEAVLAAVPVVDTLKRSDAAGLVTATVPRDRMWAAQTPQGFAFPAILAAHRAAAAAGRDDFTDDAAVAEWGGLQVRLIEGDARNGKVTTAEDIAAADRRLALEGYLALADVRVGTGYDVHRLVPGDHVTLGGVRIAHDRALDGHSDADVALHALTDAILGALGDGDIGQHFPPSDPRWRGADSTIFLAEASRRVAARGGVIAHADVSIIAEAPKIGPHREAMRARIAAVLGITIDRVGVKATTNERLGFVGRNEGIAAIATATVRLPFAP